MLKTLKIFITLLCILFTSFVYAENNTLDGNILYTVPNTGGSDDFHTGKIIHLNYNHYYLPWLAITGGLFFSEEIADETRTDIVGTSQVTLQTRGLTLGVRPEHKFSDRNKIFGRVGLLYYDTKLRVDEFFAAGLPVGTSIASTTGNGFFISMGWAHSLTENVSFQLELMTQKQTDLFDGKTRSENVFDLTNTGFSLGIGYVF